MSFTYNKFMVKVIMNLNIQDHNMYEGQGSFMYSIKCGGRWGGGGGEILHISMKSVIGVRFVPLLRVDERWSANFGSVNGGTS